MNDFVLDQVPVSVAADVLGVHPSRVRAMIDKGQLVANKLGGRWFVDRRSLEKKRSRAAVMGRPFGPANAWALLHLSQGRRPEWVSRWELSRLRRRLRENGLQQLAPRLRNRASRELLRAHPSILPRLHEDARLVRSGVSAASDHGIDIVESNELEAYVRVLDFERVVEENYLVPSSNPNVILHVADGRWLDPSESRVMDPVVSALDLLEADDEKSRRAGREFLRSLNVHPDPRHDHHPHS